MYAAVKIIAGCQRKEKSPDAVKNPDVQLWPSFIDLTIFGEGKKVRGPPFMFKV
jgi:hypothetical protein